MYYVNKEFRFEAAHSLPHLPPEHKCHHLHGHSYKVVVSVSGLISKAQPWVMDYAELSAAVDPIIARLDHKNINDVLDGASTSEYLAYWICKQLPHRMSVHEVLVYETPTCWVRFTNL